MDFHWLINKDLKAWDLKIFETYVLCLASSMEGKWHTEISTTFLHIILPRERPFPVK